MSSGTYREQIKNLLSFKCLMLVFLLIGTSSIARGQIGTPPNDDPNVDPPHVSEDRRLFLLSHLPPQDNVLCDDFAADLAENLEKFAQSHLNHPVKIIRALCIDPQGTVLTFENKKWDITIIYESPSDLPLVTTDGRPMPERTGYKTQDECLAALAIEKAVFERKTKLPVFLSYCSVPKFSAFVWETIILSFGSTDSAPHVGYMRLGGIVLNHTQESFLSMLKKGLEPFNLEFTQIQFTEHFGTNIIYRYYGKQLPIISEFPVALFQSKEQCLAEVEPLRKAMSERQLAEIGAYCEVDSSNPDRAYLEIANFFNSSIRSVKPGLTFTSLDDCERKKVDLVDHYNTKLKRDIFAGYCAYISSRNNFQIILLENEVR